VGICFFIFVNSARNERDSFCGYLKMKSLHPGMVDFELMARIKLFVVRAEFRQQ